MLTGVCECLIDSSAVLLVWYSAAVCMFMVMNDWRCYAGLDQIKVDSER